MSEITSQEYLDMCSQLQGILKENEEKKEKAENKLLEYKKFAITTYGVAQFTEENIIKWSE